MFSGWGDILFERSEIHSLRRAALGVHHPPAPESGHAHDYPQGRIPALNAQRPACQRAHLASVGVPVHLHTHED